MEYFDEVQTWYLLFEPRRLRRSCWWHWLVHDEFAHVCLLREINATQSLMLNPQRWGMAVRIIDQPVEELITTTAPLCTAVLSYTADYRRNVDTVRRGPISCVSLVKAVLGLRKCPFVLRPFGLYKLLCRQPLTNVVKPYVPYITGN